MNHRRSLHYLLNQRQQILHAQQYVPLVSRSMMMTSQIQQGTVPVPRWNLHLRTFATSTSSCTGTLKSSSVHRSSSNHRDHHHGTNAVSLSEDEALLSICRQAREFMAVSECNAAADLLTKVQSVTNLSHASLLILHQILLTVTQACLNEKNVLSARKALELVLFAERIGLPCTLPMYDEVASSCGMYLDHTDVMLLVDSIKRLGVAPSYEFFMSALYGFVEKEQSNFKAALAIANVLKEEYNYTITFQSSARILKAIKSNMTKSSDNKRKTRSRSRTSIPDMKWKRHTSAIKESEWAIELALLAAENVGDFLNKTVAPSSDEVIDAALAMIEVADDEDDDDLESNTTIETLIHPDEFENDLSYGWEDGDNSEFDVEISEMDSDVINIGGKQDTFESYPSNKDFDGDDEIRTRFYEIYVRNRHSWALPDITSQLIKMNGDGEDLLFTIEEENDLYNALEDEINRP